MMNKKHLLKIKYLLMVGLLSACVPALVVGGATATVGALHDRRGVSTYLDDNAIEMSIGSKFLTTASINANSHINVTAYNGLVLLTGEVAHPNLRQEATAIARNTKGVRTVSNHLVVGRNSTLSERGYDTTQTAKVKTALMSVNIQGFDFTRVKVVSEHGVTYLLGLVSAQEAQAVIHQARQVSGVKSVVNLLEIRR